MNLLWFENLLLMRLWVWNAYLVLLWNRALAYPRALLPSGGPLSREFWQLTTPLSPKLFNEFLQDLRKYLNPKYGLKIGDLYLVYLLFADDIVLFSEFAVNLQAQIELFFKYCEIWNLMMSIAKKIVIYHQIYAKHSFSFTLGENALEIVDKYKYLGIWCSNNKKIFVKKTFVSGWTSSESNFHNTKLQSQLRTPYS